MNEPGKTRCDRCGIEIRYGGEYRLDRYDNPKGFLPSFGSSYWRTLGEYCEECGLIIERNANIRRG